MSQYPTVIDPEDDTPNKMIWMLYGWLIFEDRPWTYERQLRELARLLAYQIDVIDDHEREMLVEEAKETLKVVGK